MNSDFSDLRFSDASATIHYYIESYTESSTASVWIKLTSATTIYKHWGKASATSESNASNVFDLYDDFAGTLGAAPNSEIWQDVYTGKATLSGDGKLILAPAASSENAAAIKSVNTIAYNSIIEIRQYSVNGYYVDTSIGTGSVSASDAWHPKLNSGYWFFTNNSTSSKILTVDSGGTVADLTTAGTVLTTSTWETHGFRYSAVPAWLVGGSVVQSASDTNYTDAAYLLVSQGQYSDDRASNREIEWIRVRKYAATEPSFSEGAVQEVSTPSPVAVFSADVTTGAVPLTVTFTDSSENTPTSWAWAFGDGETSAVQSPSHQYVAPGTYKVSLTATNAGGNDTETKIDYIEVTPSASTIFIYTRVYEMDHKVNSTRKHGFKISAWNGSGFKSTCTNPEISCTVNELDETTETWTISAFSATMNRFTLEVVDPGTWVAGDNIHIQIICDEGVADLFLNIVPDYSLLATAQSITDIKGATWADETLVTIQAAVETGGTGTGGNEQVLESTDYTFDASAKTITLLGDYATLELPQILSIKNVTKGLMTIYDCDNPLTAITLATSVISWTPDFKYRDQDFEDMDELQIIVNKK